MSSSRHNSNESQSLWQLLCDTDLLNYHDDFKFKLKVTTLEHLKYVTESDLVDIGMTKPELRRLMEFKRKLFPDTVLGKLKKKVKESVSGSSFKDQSALNNRFSNSDSNVYTTEQHIIPSGKIVLCQQLGGGEFGEVWQGVWKISASEKVQVAVKCIPASKMASNTLSFVQEAAIMHKIRHENIVKFYGVVLEPKSIMLVTELASLRSLHECLNRVQAKVNFNVLRLCDYAKQICSGMTYLESNRLIHRDLASRNILVFALDRVKISDFGLSRALGAGEEYYRGDFAVSARLPIAWCAPECIKYLKFTSASDVWSFGVTLWEMFTYGFQPWLGMTGRQILDAIDNPKGQRLEMPDDCPADYYNMMLRTWQHDESHRPKFDDLAQLLPDLRPEVVRTVSCCSDGQPDHLQYDADDLLVVLNKRPKEYPDGYFWKGVVLEKGGAKNATSKRGCGRTGLFSPANTISHLPVVSRDSCDANFANTASHLSPPTAYDDLSDSKPKHSVVKNEKKQTKISRKTISRPQDDLRHTGHVGLDGSCFGNVGFLSDKSHLPLQVVAPYTSSMSNEELSSCSPGLVAKNLRRSATPTAGNNCGLSHFPSLVTSSADVVDRIEHQLLSSCGSGDRRLNSATSETASLLPSASPKKTKRCFYNRGAVANDYPTDFNSNTNFDNCSLLEEVFDALQIKGYLVDDQVQRAECSTVDGRLTKRAKSHDNTLDRHGGTPLETDDPPLPLQLLSPSDLKMLDDLSHLAAKMSEAAFSDEKSRIAKLINEKSRNTDTLENDSGPSSCDDSSSARSSVLIEKLSKFSSRKTAAAGALASGSFCDGLSSNGKDRNVEDELGADALNAYKTLVDEGVPSTVNPLHLLRNDDGATVVKSFRRPSSFSTPAVTTKQFGAGGGSDHQSTINHKIIQGRKEEDAPPVPPKTTLTLENKTDGTEKNRVHPPPIPPKPIVHAARPIIIASSPIVPPKPKVDVAIGKFTNTQTPIVVDNAVSSTLNLNTVEDVRSNGLDEKQLNLDYFPQFTAETVNKYELLNFVLAPISDDKN